MNTCIVTGADGGIGFEVAWRLIRDGWRVFATGLGDLSDKAPFESGNDMAAYVPADLTGPGSCEKIVDGCVERFGGVNGLVHCAGVSKVGSLQDFDQQEWEHLIDVNLGSAFRMTQAVAKPMLAAGQGGSIVMISSIAWQTGGANPAYGAAKGGMNSMVFYIAQMLGPSGVRANAIAPGIIATDMVRNAFGDRYAALEKAASARTPLRRLGRPEEVAETAAFLMSERASFITGTVIPVTGGIEMLPPIGNLLEPGT